jgi:hypothetical protein
MEPSGKFSAPLAAIGWDLLFPEGERRSVSGISMPRTPTVGVEVEDGVGWAAPGLWYAGARLRCFIA